MICLCDVGGCSCYGGIISALSFFVVVDEDEKKEKKEETRIKERRMNLNSTKPEPALLHLTYEEIAV